MPDIAYEDMPRDMSGEWQKLKDENEVLRKQLDCVKSVLRDHWITSVNCDKLDGTNRASCSCSAWRGHLWTSVGAAVDEWIKHVFEQTEIKNEH